MLEKNFLTIVTIASVVSFTVSCNESTETSLEKIPSKQYENNRSDSSFARKPPQKGTRGNLCRLVKHANEGAGIYKIDSIKQDPKKYPGRTHIRMSSVSKWTSDAVSNPKVILPMGPRYEDGQKEYKQMAAAPSVRRGKEYVIMLRDVDPGRNQKIFFNEYMIFKKSKSDEGYTNGFLFKNAPVPLRKLKGHLVDMYDGIKSKGECPYNIRYSPKSNGPTEAQKKEEQTHDHVEAPSHSESRDAGVKPDSR